MLRFKIREIPSEGECVTDNPFRQPRARGVITSPLGGEDGGSDELPNLLVGMQDLSTVSFVGLIVGTPPHRQ